MISWEERFNNIQSKIIDLNENMRIVQLKLFKENKDLLDYDKGFYEGIERCLIIMQNERIKINE